MMLFFPVGSPKNEKSEKSAANRDLSSVNERKHNEFKNTLESPAVTASGAELVLIWCET